MIAASVLSLATLAYSAAAAGPEWKYGTFVYKVEDRQGDYATVSTASSTHTTDNQFLTAPCQDQRKGVQDAIELKFPNVQCKMNGPQYGKIGCSETTFSCRGMPPKVDRFLVKCDDNLSKCRVTEAPVKPITLTFTYETVKNVDLPYHAFTPADEQTKALDVTTQLSALWGATVKTPLEMDFDKADKSMPIKGGVAWSRTVRNVRTPLPKLPNPFKIACDFGSGPNGLDYWDKCWALSD